MKTTILLAIEEEDCLILDESEIKDLFTNEIYDDIKIVNGIKHDCETSVDFHNHFVEKYYTHYSILLPFQPNSDPESFLVNNLEYLELLIERKKALQLENLRKKEKDQKFRADNFKTVACHANIQLLAKYLKQSNKRLTNEHCRIIYECQVFFGLNSYEEWQGENTTTPEKIIRGYYKRYFNLDWFKEMIKP